MNGPPTRPSAEDGTAHFPRAVPCCDHAFDDHLMCRCGVSWWAHQRLPETCPLNARGRNRSREGAPPGDASARSRGPRSRGGDGNDA